VWVCILTFDLYFLQAYELLSKIPLSSHILDLLGEEENKLNEFGDLVNRERYWTVNEILKENTAARRALVIKKMIKVALSCVEIYNFNSAFAIVSGLGHCVVSRLRASWDKVSSLAGLDLN